MLTPLPLGSLSPTTHINKGKLSHCGWPLCLLTSAADSVLVVAGTFLHPLHGDQCSTLNGSWASVGSPFRHVCVSQVTVPPQTTRPTVWTSWVPTASRLRIHPFCMGTGDPIPADGKLVTSMSVRWNHSTRVEAVSHGISAMNGSQVRTLDLDLGDCTNSGYTQLPLPFRESQVED